MLRLITLDMTNTILKFRKPPGEQYAAIARLYGLDPDPVKLSQAFRLSFKQLEREAPNFGAGDIGWQQWWLGLVSRTFTSAGCPADTSSLDNVGHHLIRHFSGGNAYELFDGSTALLEDIRRRNVLLGAISNSDERLEGILVHLGVRHYFDFVLTSYAAKVAKPNPKIFQQALSCAGSNITSCEALHIGDDLQRDYLAARRCGWHSVLVCSQLHQLCQEAGLPLDGASMVTCLNYSWSVGSSNLRSHTNGGEHNGRGRHGWSLAFALGLSIFSSNAEGEEKKRESDLIVMIKRGILALKGGELKKAEQLLHVALRMAQETSNQQAVTYIFDLLANLAYQREEYPKAERLFRDVLQQLLSGGMAEDDNAVVEISLKLASVYASEGDLEKAVQGFQFCIATQEKKINKEGEAALDEDTLLLWAMSMDWYARFLLNLQKYELAKQHFLKAYEMSVRVNGSSHSQTAVLLNDIGSVCSLQKNYTEAIDYLEKAITAAREAQSPEIGSFYVNLGTVYLQQGLHGEARRCCREGLTLSRKLKNKDSAEEAGICLAEIEKVIKEEETK